MCGHGSFPGDPALGVAGLWEGAGVLGVGVVGVVDGVVLAALVVVLGAAAAPLMLAAVPAVASAPATIVAPSILNLFMMRPPGVDWLCASHRRPPG